MLPLVDYFTTCTEVGKSKEHPDIFTTCAAQFGAAPQETVVFEDSAYAIRTARAAGFPVVAVEDAISTQGKTGDETREGPGPPGQPGHRRLRAADRPAHPGGGPFQGLGELLG